MLVELIPDYSIWTRRNFQLKQRKSQLPKIELTLTAAEEFPVAFFNRISLIDANTGERLLPTFFSDNYVSVTPGGEKKITLSYDQLKNTDAKIEIEGWNVPKQTLDLN